jgi:RsiW-degrading membrane proteinase PrsW (M82 family)
VTETQHKIFFLTRHPPFLWGLGLGTLVVGLLIAYGVSFFRPAPVAGVDEIFETAWQPRVAPELFDQTMPPRQGAALLRAYAGVTSFREALRVLVAYGQGLPEQELDSVLEELAEARPFPPAQFEVVRALLYALNTREPAATTENGVEPLEQRGEASLPEPLRQLERERGGRGQAARDVYLAQAEFWLSRLQYEKADAALQKARVPERLREARREWVEYLLYRDEFSKIRELMEDPGFEEHISALTKYLIAAEEYDWEGMLRNLVPSQYESKTPGVLFLAGLTGLFWWLILLRVFQVPARSLTTVLTLAALVLGAISTWPTLLSAVWQEQAWGLDPALQGGDPVNQIIYSIAGTGLREELCKLLLFLPLVPILLKRNQPREILLVAACVGLGFAVEENLNYFEQASTAVAGRFVTANFAHCIFTGLIGYNFCRCLRDWRQHLSSFLGVFTIMVFSHGLYNALMSYELGSGFLSIMLFIFLSWMFFQLADSLRAPGYSIISATSLFIFGLSLMLACTLVVLSFQMPVAMAGFLMAGMAMDSLVLGIMFTRCFGEVTEA